jgi:hypothetical protein
MCTTQSSSKLSNLELLYASCSRSGTTPLDSFCAPNTTNISATSGEKGFPFLSDDGLCNGIAFPVFRGQSELLEPILTTI